MRSCLKYLLFPLNAILIFFIYIYKFLISPILPKTCRFFPSCSTYFIESVKEFGPFKGTVLGLKRISRCTPNNKRKGYDPVPINLKGVKKWIF